MANKILYLVAICLAIAAAALAADSIYVHAQASIKKGNSNVAPDHIIYYPFLNGVIQDTIELAVADSFAWGIYIDTFATVEWGDWDILWEYSKDGDTLLDWQDNTYIAYSVAAGGVSGLPIKLFVYDTDNSVMLQGALISLYQLDGTPYQAGYTGTDGNVVLGIQSADTLLLTVYYPGFYFNLAEIKSIVGIYGRKYDTLFVLDVGAVDTIDGQGFTIAAPAAPDLCTVYGDISDVNGDPIEKAKITGTLLKGPREIVTDTCAQRFIVQYSDDDKTDSLGQFEMILIKSHCLTGGGIYEFQIYNPKTRMTTTFTDSIPDSSTYRLQVEAW